MKKIALVIALSLLLSACTAPTADTLGADLSRDDIAPIIINVQADDGSDQSTAIAGFSLDILEQSNLGENTLISPLSIISALAMTANGAENETLHQMETVFGADIEKLNDYLYAYTSTLPEEKKCKLSLANSIWFTDSESLTVERDFLQTNKNYYDAEIYRTPFDSTTQDDINKWVDAETDGMIDKLLEEAPDPDTVMYLINALSFDAEWMDIYEESQVHEGEFTTADGETQSVDFMRNEEFSYIDLPNATGFSKRYEGDEMSFVALLPNEGVSLEDFVADLDEEALINALRNQSAEEVIASVPKFTFEYKTELKPILTALGMTDAFDSSVADLTSLGTDAGGNLYIDDVIHKTKIEVNEKGTKAGAATAVVIKAESASEENPKQVILNRPFFFMIVDNNYNLPVFMGVLNSVD